MRKILAVLCAVLVITNVFAVPKTYYVSGGGNDANNGLTTSAAFRTIAKINSLLSNATIAAGDSVLLNCNYAYFDTLNITKGIYLGSYGVGAKPVISGMYTITTWTSLGGGIYESEAITTSNLVNVVSINNTEYAMGRYPNADASIAGYLIFESHSNANSADADTITDNTHSTVLDNTWAGAQVAIRISHYQISKATIASITGSSNTAIGYTGLTPSASISNNFGFFVQNSLKTLDQFGEWYFNPTTKKLDVYFGSSGPGSNVVQVATKNTLLWAHASNITINNIALTGATGNCIANEFSNLSGITITNCNISFAGLDGISARGVTHITITNNNINWVNSCAVDLYNSIIWANVSNNTLNHVGVLTGQIDKDLGGYFATGVNSGDGDSITAQYNDLHNIGYIGFRHNDGNNVLWQYNTVDSFEVTLDDAGAYYTWSSSSNSKTLHDRYMLNNIATNGIATGYGTAENAPWGADYYTDDRSKNIVIQGNTGANSTYRGGYFHNSQNITITNNVFYNNAVGGLEFQHDNSAVTMTGFIVKNNNILAKTTGQTLINVRSNWNDFNTLFSSLDSNYYGRATNDNGAFVRNWFLNSTLTYTFPNWQTYIAAEAHSARTNIADMSKVIFNTNSRRVNSTLHFCAACMGLDNQPLFNRLPMNSFTSVLMLKSN